MDNRTTIGRPYHLGGQTIAVGVAASTPVQLGEGVTAVKVTPTVDCWIEIHSTSEPAQVAKSDFLPANFPWVYRFPDGGYISVIRDSVDGNLHVMPYV